MKANRDGDDELVFDSGEVVEGLNESLGLDRYGDLDFYLGFNEVDKHVEVARFMIDKWLDFYAENRARQKAK